MKSNERCKAAIKYIAGITNSTQKDVGIQLGYSNESAFSQILNGKVATPKKFIKKICNLFPDLNEEWLLTGEGEMLAPQTISATNSTVVGSNIRGNGNQITHNDMSEMIKLQQGYQDLLRKKDEQMDKLIEIIAQSKNK